MGAPAVRDRIALLSCGLDSYVMWRMEGRPRSIYFCDKSLPSAQAELDRVIDATEGTCLVRWTNTAEPDAAGFIPYRNLLFILKVSCLHPPPLDILIGQTLEWQVDKNPAFYREVRSIARRLGRRDLRVIAPLRNMTKTEMVAWFKSCHPTTAADEIRRFTFSCLRQSDEHCGYCSSCVHRYVALRNNGFDVGLVGEAVFGFEHLPTWGDYVTNTKMQLWQFRPQNGPMYLRRYLEARRALKGA